MITGVSSGPSWVHMAWHKKVVKKKLLIPDMLFLDYLQLQPAKF